MSETDSPHQIGYPIKTVSEFAQLSTFVLLSFTSRKNSSLCSLITLELSSVQSKSADVYLIMGTISNRSAFRFLDNSLATLSVESVAE